MIRLVVAAIIAVAALSILTAPALGQNTISQQRALGTPGAWVLTQDLIAPCNGTPMLDVQVDGVTLDLGGFVPDCTVLGETGNHFSDNRFRSVDPSVIPCWDQSGGNIDGGRNVS